jgi:amino acid transporter
VLFVAQTWVAALIVPDFTSFKNLDVAFYDVAQVAGGVWLMMLCSIATAIAWGIANALAAQAAIARVLYSMSRDRYLPSALATVHPKFQTPWVATAFVAIVSIVVTGIFSSQIGALTSLVNFGALSAFLLLHISVINHFLVRQHSRDYVRHLVGPVLGFLVIAYVWISLDVASKTLGVSWLVIGVVYFVFLTYVLKRRPTQLGV